MHSHQHKKYHKVFYLRMSLTSVTPSITVTQRNHSPVSLPSTTWQVALFLPCACEAGRKGNITALYTRLYALHLCSWQTLSLPFPLVLPTCSNCPFRARIRDSCVPYPRYGKGSGFVIHQNVEQISKGWDDFLMIKTSQKLKEVMSEPWSFRALDTVGLHMVYAVLVANKWCPYSKRCSVDPKHQTKRAI